MQQFKLIVINGVAQNGKNEFVNAIKELTNVVNLSTVSTVKAACRLFGANEDIHKGDEERLLWNEVKKAWIKYDNGPFNELKMHIALLEKYNFKGIVFIHVREPEEIEKIKNHFINCKALLIKGFSDYVPNNDADSSVFNFVYDYIIENTGSIEELKASAKVWYDLYILEKKKRIEK